VNLGPNYTHILPFTDTSKRLSQKKNQVQKPSELNAHINRLKIICWWYDDRSRASLRYFKIL